MLKNRLAVASNSNIPLVCDWRFLTDAKRMKNILAHEYGEVDDKIVFNAIKNELERDAKDFINSIKASPAKKEIDSTKGATTIRNNHE